MFPKLKKISLILITICGFVLVHVINKYRIDENFALSVELKVVRYKQ